MKNPRIRINGDLVFAWVRTDKGVEGCHASAEQNFHLDEVPEEEDDELQDMLRQIADEEAAQEIEDDEAREIAEEEAAREVAESDEPTREELNDLDRQEAEDEWHREEE